LKLQDQKKPKKHRQARVHIPQEVKGFGDVVSMDSVEAQVLGVEALHLLAELLVDGSNDQARG
jgi:hypothetical protein